MRRFFDGGLVPHIRIQALAKLLSFRIAVEVLLLLYKNKAQGGRKYCRLEY